MSIHTDALAKIPPLLLGAIQSQYAAWAGDSIWKQITDNIDAECSLACTEFESLLQKFADQLMAAVDPAAAWRNACDNHKLCGSSMTAASRPAVLGRACRVEHFATSVYDSNRHLSSDQAKRLVEKYAGRTPPSTKEVVLRRGMLGGAVIWATFDEVNGALDPFQKLPEKAEDVCTALGLGYHPLPEAVLILVFSSAAPVHGLPLHRPTVADASDYHFYRPHPDPVSPHGYSQPLAPNSVGYAPMPEIVHAQVSGAALILPYRILV